MTDKDLLMALLSVKLDIPVEMDSIDDEPGQVVIISKVSESHTGQKEVIKRSSLTAKLYTSKVMSDREAENTLDLALNKRYLFNNKIYQVTTTSKLYSHERATAKDYKAIIYNINMEVI